MATDWESEARERLASVETQQDNIENRLEILREGQNEIMSKLTTMEKDAVTQEDLEEVQQTTESNTEARERKEGAYKALAIIGSTLAGASGYALAVI